MAKSMLLNTVELLYVGFMARWVNTAPPDQHAGWLDGEREYNSQISRLAYILRKIAAGNADHVYQTLAVYSRRFDGGSYFSKHAQDMTNPYSLSHGWCFEGCANVDQKLSWVRHLTKLSLSPALIACIEDFVAHNSVEGHIPSAAEQDQILARSIAAEQQFTLRPGSSAG